MNLAKAKQIPTNISRRKGEKLPQFFGCKTSTFPIKYLGGCLSSRKLRKSIRLGVFW